MLWHSATIDNQTTNTGSQTILDVLAGLQGFDKGDIRRIIRCILTFSVRSSAAGSLVNGRFGLVVVTNDAFTAAAVPDPAGDLSASWLVNTHYYQEDAANVPVDRPADLRASRLLPGALRTLVFVLDAGGTANSVWNLGLRVLLGMR